MPSMPVVPPRPAPFVPPRPSAAGGSQTPTPARPAPRQSAAAQIPLGVPLTPPIGVPSIPSAPPRPTASAPRPSSATPTRAPINPFLANDPNAKARRLSRALISDLVTYYPQRRDEGLRDGTLKELFREEIRKSYEEYVDQVGKEFADSTTHFQEALNDILSGGQKMF